MTYGVIVEVSAPIEAYDVSHDEVAKALAAGSSVEGLIVHVARATSGGFELFEVWETKEHSDRFGRDVLAPIMERLGMSGGPEPRVTEFEPRSVMALQVYSSDDERTDTPG